MNQFTAILCCLLLLSSCASNWMSDWSLPINNNSCPNIEFDFRNHVIFLENDQHLEGIDGDVSVELPKGAYYPAYIKSESCSEIRYIHSELIKVKYKSWLNKMFSREDEEGGVVTNLNNPNKVIGFWFDVPDASYQTVETKSEITFRYIQIE